MPLNKDCIVATIRVLGVRVDPFRPDSAPTSKGQIPREPTAHARDFLTWLIAQGCLTYFDAKVIQIVGELNYWPLTKLGEGGAGLVLLVRDATNKQFALKIYKPIPQTFNNPRTLLKKAIKEIKTLQSLTHANIVRVHQWGNLDDVPYYVMDYVEGQDLSGYRAVSGEIGWQEAISIIRNAASTLEYCHQRNIVHRDVKPNNLIRAHDKSIKLVDFGLALGQHSDSSSVGEADSPRFVGSAHYSAPETINEPQQATPRSDIYSLGCTFFFLLTGFPPFTGKSVSEVLQKHKTSPMPRLEDYGINLPIDATSLLEKMLAKSPENRFQTIAELMLALDQEIVRLEANVLEMDPTRFLRYLNCPYAEFDDAAPPSNASYRTPNFILCERAGKKLMAILSDSHKVDLLSLQKTNDPQTHARLLAPDEILALGFAGADKVHPTFQDPTRRLIDTIAIDAVLLAQAILFPTSMIVVPLYAQGYPKKIAVPIHSFLFALVQIHGLHRLLFANISRPGWPDQTLINLLRTLCIHSRFAPTPSNNLHLGNARTALISYLASLNGRTGSTFSLRIDNTDEMRCDDAFVDSIKNDLRVLGIRWTTEFAQNSQNRLDVYQKIERILRFAGLLNIQEDGSSSLNSPSAVARADYWLTMDLRLGPRIKHGVPVNKEYEQKEIRLVRCHGKPPFYRFAGCVDDIQKSTFVVRDIGQFGLTEIQTHIRHGIELARQAHHTDESRRKMLEDANLDPDRSIPLPIFIHVSRIVDKSGDKISKSNAAQSQMYRLHYLLQEQAILPESIVTYLLSTIPGISLGESLDLKITEIAKVVAHLGCHGALHYYAQRTDIFGLARSTKDVKCELGKLLRAERECLRVAPLWRLKTFLDRSIGTSGLVADLDIMCRIRQNVGHFASFREIRELIRGPSHSPVLTVSSRKLLDDIRAAWFETAKLGKIGLATYLLDWIASTRIEAKANPRTRKVLACLLADLRLALIGLTDSPKIEVMIEVLGDQLSVHRIWPRGAVM